MKKIIKYTALSLLVVVGVTSLVNYSKLKQLYHTIRLFHSDVIVSNFSNMSTLAPTKTIDAPKEKIIFNQIDTPIPKSFNYKGEDLSMDQWLKDSSTTALVVMQGNNITFEDYYQGTLESDLRISWSMAKSFLSAMFGVAVEDGLIPDLNAPVTDYAPELIGSGYDGVTIKNVLQMSSGIFFNEDYQDFNSDINRFGRIMALGGSFDDFAKSLTNERPQGSYMHYVSIDTHVVGMVLRGATGQSIEQYFNDKLWSKLGAEREVQYLTDSTGEPMVLGGLNMISRDYARLGLLYRDNGMFNGKQVVPRAWVEASITPDAPHLMPGVRDSSSTDFGYGYQWWIPTNADEEFLALGIYGQYIYINRKADVVIVKNSADIGFMDNGYESKDFALAAFREISRALITQ